MQFNLFHFTHKNGMHLGMFQGGGELSRLTGRKALTQIVQFHARPKECYGV